jgi:hypothetical protein
MYHSRRLVLALALFFTDAVRYSSARVTITKSTTILQPPAVPIPSPSHHALHHHEQTEACTLVEFSCPSFASEAPRLPLLKTRMVRQGVLCEYAENKAEAVSTIRNSTENGDKTKDEQDRRNKDKKHSEIRIDLLTLTCAFSMVCLHG